MATYCKHKWARLTGTKIEWCGRCGSLKRTIFVPDRLLGETIKTIIDNPRNYKKKFDTKLIK